MHGGTLSHQDDPNPYLYLERPNSCSSAAAAAAETKLQKKIIGWRMEKQKKNHSNRELFLDSEGDLKKGAGNPIRRSTTAAHTESGPGTELPLMEWNRGDRGLLGTNPSPARGSF